jgi:hypothetical protein
MGRAMQPPFARVAQLWKRRSLCLTSTPNEGSLCPGCGIGEPNDDRSSVTACWRHGRFCGARMQAARRTSGQACSNRFPDDRARSTLSCARWIRMPTSPSSAAAGGRARGRIIEVVGRVLDLDGRPVPNAKLDLWQANAAGRYAHPGDDNPRPLIPTSRVRPPSLPTPRVAFASGPSSPAPIPAAFPICTST